MRKNIMGSENISVIKFENNKIPTFAEVKGRNIISYGEKNDYPEYLINLFNRSAKHNAIITGKVNFIKGQGFEIDESKFTPEQKIKFNSWIKNISANDTLESLHTKVITDLELFDGFYLEVIPNQLSNSIAQINHVGFEKIRINKDKNGYFYSNDWQDYRQTKEKTGFEALEPYVKSAFKGLFRYKKYRPGTNIYPIPEYIGCIPYIEIDYEIANYHLNNIKNGFVGGTLLNFNNGVPDAEAKREIEKNVKGKFTGTDNAGQLIITFSNNKDSAPTVIPLMPNDFDKMFIQLNETVVQEIFTGHKITSLSIFGIKENKGLGSKDELKDAFALFQNTYITNRQLIVDGIFNDLAESSGFGRPFKTIPVELIDDKLQMSEAIKVMTVAEIRERSGLPVLEAKTEKANQAILDAINTLSPLVVTKVLNEMSSSEIRDLISLPPNTLPAKMSQCFHSQIKIDAFKNIGVSKDSFKIIKSKEILDRLDAANSEIGFYKEKFLDSETLQPKILDLINGNPNITPEEIAKILGEKPADIKKELSDLIDRKLLSSNNKALVVSPEGVKVIEEAPTEPQKVEVLYSYEERKNLPPLLTESRDFCTELIALNKLYTRAEIELISEQEGRDVWATRGGYFHNTKLDQTTPYCRHIWFQNVVRRK